MGRPVFLFAILTLLATLAPAVRADEMPIREVTVFKDGHAFVLQRGEMPVDKAGHVTLDALPKPVLGTFWPFSAEEGVQLRSVTAGMRRVSVERTALTLPDLLAANIGAQVVVTDVDDHSFSARIRGFPERSSEELDATAPPGTGPALPVRSTLVLLETDDGLRVMSVARIRDVVFRSVSDTRSKGHHEAMRPRMTLVLDGMKPNAERADVGMLSLQKGLRWIPSTRVDLLDDGRARLQLQATLVNDLADLEDVGLNLVIGVPTFAFEHLLDPISLQENLARVARAAPRQALTGQFLSNAIMTQTATMAPPSEGAAADASMTTAGEGHEDLFVFHLEHVSLKKGERLVVPVTDVVLPYEDVYTLELPFSPPPDAWPQVAQYLVQNPQERQAARLLALPKVMHEIRLTNDGPAPLTTSPALILKKGQVLAQGMLTYTSVGATVDLPVTAAVDVKTHREEREVMREEDAATWGNHDFARVDLAGTLRLVNHKKKTIHLEVRRYVLGTKPTAQQGGSTRALNALEDAAGASWTTPGWWRWVRWADWWYHFNGMARIDWTLDLEPGEKAELEYGWSYYWR